MPPDADPHAYRSKPKRRKRKATGGDAQLDMMSRLRLPKIKGGRVIYLSNLQADWSKPMTRGVVLEHRGSQILVRWEDDGEPELWRSRDFAYWINRDRIRLAPPSELPEGEVAGTLTAGIASHSMMPSPLANGGPEQGECPNMPATRSRRKAKPEPVEEPTIEEVLEEEFQDFPEAPADEVEELTDDTEEANNEGLVVLDEADTGVEDEDEAPMGEVFSAKEVARQCGTDAKTFRKFVRETRGNGKGIVGQGGRYAFDADDVKELKAAFASWTTGKDKPKAKKEVAKVTPPEDDEVEEIDMEDVVDLDELDGPSEDDLDELEVEEIE